MNQSLLFEKSFTCSGVHSLANTCLLTAFNGQTYLNLQARAAAKLGGPKNPSSFLKATTTTLLHTISESEKACYVAHVNSYLRDDPFLKQFLPMDPATNALFDLAKDGVLLWYLRTVWLTLLYLVMLLESDSLW